MSFYTITEIIPFTFVVPGMITYIAFDFCSAFTFEEEF